MPDIGFYHPILIHFAIGFVVGGVLLRWLSLVTRSTWASAAATALIVLGTVVTLLATQSGEDAHVAVEGAPGVAALVRAHERWGEWTRNAVVLLAALELLALVRRGPGTSLLCTGVGVVALACILQTGKLGGELVYGYAGGVGIRSGNPADIAHLFLAGLVRQAEADQNAGRTAEAVSLLALAAQRFPADAEVQTRAAEAVLEDRHDPAAALAILERTPASEPPLRFRRDWLTADALDALGRRAEARALLERLQSDFPDNPRLRRRLARTDVSANRP